MSFPVSKISKASKFISFIRLFIQRPKRHYCDWNSEAFIVHETEERKKFYNVVFLR